MRKKTSFFIYLPLHKQYLALMRKLKLLFLLAFTSLAESYAQDQRQWKELVLKVPELNENDVARIQRQMNCFENIHFSGYVPTARCLILKYDPNTFHDHDIIPCTINYLNRIPVEVINSFSIYDVVDGKLDEE